MVNVNLWSRKKDGTLTYFPAAMQIGGHVRPEDGKFRATLTNFYEGVTMPPSDPTELFDTEDQAQDWVERRWLPARRQAGLA